jgi:hypothetical protein
MIDALPPYRMNDTCLPHEIPNDWSEFDTCTKNKESTSCSAPCKWTDVSQYQDLD